MRVDYNGPMIFASQPVRRNISVPAYLLTYAIGLSCVTSADAAPNFGSWCVSTGTISTGTTPTGTSLSDSGFVQRAITDSGTPTAGTIIIETGTPDVRCSTTSQGSSVLINTINQFGEPTDRAEPYAYIPNTLDNTVSVIGTITFNTYTTVPVQVSPYGVAVEPRGLRAYIGNRASNSVSVIDADTLAVIDTIPTGANPAGLALIDEGGKLLVANESENTLSVFDTTTLAEIKRVDLSNPPHAIVVSPVAPVAYVLSRSAAVVSVIDLDTLTETTTLSLAVDDHTQPTAMAISPDGARLFTILVTPDATSSALTVTNTTTGTVDYPATFDLQIVDITQSTDGSSLYLVPYTTGQCSDIQELDTATYATVAAHTVPGGLVRAVSAGQRFKVISQTSNTFVNTSYTMADGQIGGVQSGSTGNDPDALGDFIGPTRTPEVTADTAALNFGETAVHSTATRTVTVTNTGNLPLKTYEPRIDTLFLTCLSNTCDSSPVPEFSVIADGCAGNTIASDDSCTITVQYAPIDNSPDSGRLLVYTNSASSIVNVTLAGTTPLPAPEVTFVGPNADANSNQNGESQAQSTATAAAPKVSSGAVGPADAFLLAFAWLSLGMINRRR
jgi:YVTN family beta-propeller protein